MQIQKHLSQEIERAEKIAADFKAKKNKPSYMYFKGIADGIRTALGAADWHAPNQ